MVAFVKGIFHDLSGRIQKMIVNLEQLKETTAIPKDFFDKTLSLLNKLNQEVNTTLVSPDISFDELAGNNILKFNTLYERFLAIELYRFQVIIHYGENEKYFNALINRIYREIECNQRPPIVSVISNNDNYYWVYPLYEIIAVPYGEERNLLNLPDLYHEIGHLIYGQFPTFLKGTIESSLDKHFRDEIQAIHDENRDKKTIPVLKEAFDSWKNSWIEEFICDLIATYLTGPCYGWTNLKISTISSTDKGIYSTTANHPSDESRMYAIFSMLQLMGHQSDIEQLKNYWASFMAISANAKSQFYDTLLPQHIISELVATVFQSCQDIGLSSYSKQIEISGEPIAQLLNQAWTENLARPENFTNWENSQTEKLIQELN